MTLPSRGGLTVVMVLLKTSCCLAVSRASLLLLPLLTRCTSTGSTHTAMTGCWTTSRFRPVTTMTRPPLRTESGHSVQSEESVKKLLVADRLGFLRVEALCGRGVGHDRVVQVAELHARDAPLRFAKQDPDRHLPSLVTGTSLAHQLSVVHLLQAEEMIRAEGRGLHQLSIRGAREPERPKY